MEEFLMQTSCYFREPCMQVCVWCGVVVCVRWGGGGVCVPILALEPKAVTHLVLPLLFILQSPGSHALQLFG